MSSLSPAANATSNAAVASLGGQGRLSVGGLISGLNTDQIIQGLLAVDRQQITDIQQRQTQVQQKQAAFKAIETHLLTVQGDIASLSRAQNGAFDGRSATSSNTDLLTAAASSDAVPGIYALTVNHLATAQQLASQGFDGPSSEITQGTLQLQTASGAATTITIDGTNNTLQGLADAINRSGAAVSASILNDGSASQPIRLLLTAKNTGTANAVTITNNLGASAGSAVKPTFDTTVQAAADASVTVGSGSGALTVTSATNQITSLINGVTLKLTAADDQHPLTVTVSNDTAGAQKSIDSFVSDYNALMQFIDQQVQFDPSTNTAGILLGDSRVTDLQEQLRSIVQSVVIGGNPRANNLSQVGITTNDSGQLVVDDSKLGTVLSGGVDGVTIQDVKKLFGLTGASPNANIQFITGSDNTRASASPYTVKITQAAQHATAVAAGTLGSSIDIGAGNNTLNLTVDGQALSVMLANGTYTQTQLVQMLQGAINASPGLGGRHVTVGIQGGALAITSASYGAGSQVSLGAGSANAALGINGSERAVGTDVVGSFVVNGVTEAAHGSGQILTGNSGNANTDGLVVRVALTPAQVGSGAQADLTVTRGLVSLLNVRINQLTDPLTGRLQSIDDSFSQQAQALADDITRNTNLMQAKQQALLQEFTAMEQALAKLQAASSLITAQAIAAGQQSSSSGSRSSTSG